MTVIAISWYAAKASDRRAVYNVNILESYETETIPVKQSAKQGF